jgi:hypothetical protein
MARHGAKKWPELALAVLAAAATVLLLLGGGAVFYWASPYFESESLMERFGNRSLTSQASEGDLAMLGRALHNYIDTIVPAVQQDEQGNLVERLGVAALTEFRQAVLRAVERLSTREGMDSVIYGWQQLQDRRVTLERGYVSFPNRFSLVMRDAATGEPLTELVLVRQSFRSWTLNAVVPHWLGTAGEDLLRSLIGEVLNSLPK